MKATNKSTTSVKKSENKRLNKSVTLVKVKKASTNKSVTSVGKSKKQEPEKKPAKVLKETEQVSNKSNTKVGSQENKGLNESVTFVESKEIQLFKNPGNFKALEEILNMKSKMAEVIDWYEKKHKNVIEIPELKINARALHGSLVLKTFKLYESAIKKIADFIEKHPQYKQQDIISQALIEFAERYH